MPEDKTTRDAPVVLVSFLPKYDFKGDARYQFLIGNMKDREIEFCKALVGVGCNKTAAMELIKPHINHNSAKKDGYRYWGKDSVQELYEYLAKLEDPDAEPLTREAMAVKFEKMFRNTNDPKTAIALGDKIMELRGFDTEVDNEDKIVEDDSWMDEILGN